MTPEDSPSFRYPPHVPLVAAIVSGVIFGIFAKLADESGIGGLSDLGSYPGAWIAIAALIAAWSPSPLRAALWVGGFMCAMVGAYYLTTQWLLGALPLRYFLAWMAVAVLLAPLFALLVWPARQRGWPAAASAALPVGILLAEAFTFRWVLPLHLFQFVFDVGMALLLLVVLPRNGPQRMRVLALVPLWLLITIGLQRLIPTILGALRG